MVAHSDLKGFMMDERVKTKSEPKTINETPGQRLDRELEDSFPASDPSSLTQPSGSDAEKTTVLGKRVKSKGGE